MFLVFLVDAFHADTDQNHDQQQDGHGDDNAHAHLDACLFRYHAYDGGGDDAACGADQDHGADTKVVALDALRAQCQRGGVDRGHEQAQTHDAYENRQLTAAEEHQQEEGQYPDAVHHEDDLAGNLAHQHRTDHAADENDHPQQAAHHLRNLVAEDACVLEVGYQPVDNGVFCGNIEEQNGGSHPEAFILQKAAVYLADALGDILCRQLHVAVDRQLGQTQQDDAEGHGLPACGVAAGAEDQRQRGQHCAHGECTVEQVIADGGFLTGEGGHHGVGEVRIAASGYANHDAGEAEHSRAADAEGDQCECHRHPYCGQQHGFAATDIAGKVACNKNRGDVPPRGKAQQEACLGIADVISLTEKGHQIPHQHRGCATDEKDEERCAYQCVFLFCICLLIHNTVLSKGCHSSQRLYLEKPIPAREESKRPRTSPRSFLILLLPIIHPCFVGLEGGAACVAVVCQQQLRSAEIKACGHTPLLGLVRERADHQKLFLIILTGVGVEAARQLAVFLIIAVFYAAEGLAQLDGLAVEVQDGICVRFLLFHVDLGVVFVHIEPRGACGEACVCLCAPLNGGAGGVTGAVPQSLQSLFGGTLGGDVVILPAGLHVLV